MCYHQCHTRLSHVTVAQPSAIQRVDPGCWPNISFTNSRWVRRLNKELVFFGTPVNTGQYQRCHRMEGGEIEQSHQVKLGALHPASE